MICVLVLPQFAEPTLPQRFCHWVCYALQACKVKQSPNDKACWHVEIFCIHTICSCCLLSTVVKMYLVMKCHSWQMLLFVSDDRGSKFAYLEILVECKPTVKVISIKILLYVRIACQRTDTTEQYTQKHYVHVQT